MNQTQWRALRLAAAGGLLLVLAGCSASAAATQEAPELSGVSVESPNIVSATGEVVPARWAVLSFPIPGQAVEILVEETMIVEAGDVLARLDTTDLDIAIIQAEAALAVAQANLALAEAGPREEEVRRAEEQLAAANARVSVAIAQREQLLAPPDPDAVISAQAQVQEAANAVESAQEGYDQIIGYLNNWDDYEFEPGDRTFLDGEQNARYSLELANLRLAAAQASLDKLLEGPEPDERRVADARIWVAAAQRDSAQAYLNLVKAGASPAEIAVSEAEVARAEAAVESARAARDQALLVAPFSGTVSSLDIDLNEWVNAGQPIITLADFTTLQVETTDLNELDVARISVDSAATVTFDALPDITLSGTVLSIAPKSSEGAGVNYTVVIALEEIPEALRWGMTAFVDIEAEQVD